MKPTRAHDTRISAHPHLGALHTIGYGHAPARAFLLLPLSNRGDEVPYWVERARMCVSIRRVRGARYPQGVVDNSGFGASHD